MHPKYMPMEVTDVELAFGGRNMNMLLPAWDDIPEEFQSGNTKWNALFNKLFYDGEVKGSITGVEGIDPRKAGRHIRAIMISREPKHEHKEAGCAFLMSLWFVDWDPEENQEDAS